MADKKVTALTALTTPAGEDLLLVVDNPSVTPISKKMSISDLYGGSSQVTVDAINLNSSATTDIASTGAIGITATAGATVTGNVTVTGNFSNSGTTADITSTSTVAITGDASITLDSPSLVITDTPGDTAVTVSGTLETTKNMRTAENLVVGSGTIPTFPGVGVIQLPVGVQPANDNTDDYPVGSILVGQTGGSYFMYLVKDTTGQTNAIVRVGFSTY